MIGLTGHEQALAVDGGRRARGIQAHRDFADFFDGHPSVPLPNVGGHEYLVLRGSDAEAMAEVDRIGAELHVVPRWNMGRYEVRRRFGDDLAYEAVCLPFSVPVPARTELAA